MSAVEIRLDPSDLSREMSAMRVWLDQHRVDASSFSCRCDESGVVVCLEFARVDEAQAFADRFGGGANRPSTVDAAGELRDTALATGVSPSGTIG
jgi:hypothetical protein